MDTMDVKVAENGRMVLPLAVRKALGLSGETKVILTLADGEVRLTSISHGVARARELYRIHAKGGRTTADFLADRARETSLEDVAIETEGRDGSAVRSTDGTKAS
jgi:AbrB family looped-hinge helix DNA binding protein